MNQQSRLAWGVIGCLFVPGLILLVFGLAAYLVSRNVRSNPTPTPYPVATRFGEIERREIFLRLSKAKDRARAQAVARAVRLSQKEQELIVIEGMSKHWPPL